MKIDIVESKENKIDSKMKKDFFLKKETSRWRQKLKKGRGNIQKGYQLG